MSASHVNGIRDDEAEDKTVKGYEDIIKSCVHACLPADHVKVEEKGNRKLY